MGKLFRDKGGKIKPILSDIEGISYSESPLDFFILLARYKFAARLLKKTDFVLDAGCGHGLGTVFLSKFAKHVTGADLDKKLILRNKNEYKKIKSVDFEQLNLLDVSTYKKQYDAVISMDVIEHFTKDDTEKVARNYAELTQNDGFAVIGTPNIISRPFASKRRKLTHLHEFEPEELQISLSKYFKRVFLFSMTDEVISLSFPKLAWYLMALCIK